VFLVEVQEPTDFSVLLERRGFVVDEARDGHLGLGDELALSCVDRSGWGAERLAALRRERGRGRSLGHGAELALPEEADRFFRVQRVRPYPEARLQASFAVLVVIAGRGSLETESGGVIDLDRGHTVVVPFGAGTQVLCGGLEVIRCLPPEEGGAEDG
jgi:mannose-6-phosphate isomerase